MAGMFTGASAFNNSGSSDINNWRPISCSNFQSMFQGANAFNQPIGNWSISASSVDMSFMFYQNILFNQSLATWNTSKVTTMRYMFGSATSFNQNLGSWLIPSCSNMANMLDNCGMSKANYSSTLTGWAAQAPNIQSNVTLGASGRQYDTPGSASRAILTSAPYNWTINGDTYVP
jgi:surface protein